MNELHTIIIENQLLIAKDEKELVLNKDEIFKLYCFIEDHLEEQRTKEFLSNK